MSCSTLAPVHAATARGDIDIASGSDGSSSHVGDNLDLAASARLSVSPFAVAAFPLELIALTLLITILMSAPPFDCLSVRYNRWVDRTELPFVAATLMVPLGVVLSVAGYFVRRRQRSRLNTSACVGALLIGFPVNSTLWFVIVGAQSRGFGCL